MRARINKQVVLPVIGTVLATLLVAGVSTAQTGLTPIEELGSLLYFDEDLSEPSGQACASCHEPGFGFVDPDSDLPVSEGVIPGRFGGRGRRFRGRLGQLLVRGVHRDLRAAL